MANVLTPDELAAVDLSVGWPVADVPQAVAVEEAESSGNPTIVGWETASGEVDTNGLTVPSAPFVYYATGLFQDLSSHDHNKGAKENDADPAWLKQMENPSANSKEGLDLFVGSGGWGPWVSDEAISGTPTQKASLLAAGQKATNDVSGDTPAQLDSIVSQVGKDLTSNGVAGPAFGAGAAIAGAASTAASFLSGGWQKAALELAGVGLAGTLVILGLYKAASPGDSGHPVVKDAAKAAAL